jgi:hypothetical protein
MKPRFFQHRHDFAKEHINPASALLDKGVNAQQAGHGEEEGNSKGETAERDRR